MAVPLPDLRVFVRESNRIEGIHRPPTKRELQAHADLLDLPELTVMHVAQFVAAVQPGAELRIREGMNVRVGNHRPPPGGSAIGFTLKGLLIDANARRTAGGSRARRSIKRVSSAARRSSISSIQPP